MAMLALTLSACGTKNTKQQEGAHVHSDGTVHEGHDHSASKQEVFEVKEAVCAHECAKDSCDSLKPSEEVHDHDHAHEHNQDHSHE